MDFSYVSQNKQIIFLRSTDCLIFVMERKFFCEVGNSRLNITYVKFKIKMFQRLPKCCPVVCILPLPYFSVLKASSTISNTPAPFQAVGM